MNNLFIIGVLVLLIIFCISRSGFKGKSGFGAPVPTTAGPMGPQGPKGPAGATGLTGPKGLDGKNGLPGPAGAMGPMGPKGLDGKNGLPGPAGAMGPMGPKGLDGKNGLPGPAGSMGPMGPMGPMGLQGPMGPQGPVGDSGPSVYCFQNNQYGTIDCSYTQPENIRWVQTGSSGNIPLDDYSKQFQEPYLFDKQFQELKDYNGQFQLLKTNLKNNLLKLIRDTCTEPRITMDTIKYIQSKMVLPGGSMNTNDLIGMINYTISTAQDSVSKLFLEYLLTIIPTNRIITQTELNSLISERVNLMCGMFKSVTMMQVINIVLALYKNYVNDPMFVKSIIQNISNVNPGNYSTVEDFVTEFLKPVYNYSEYERLFNSLVEAGNDPNYIANNSLTQGQFTSFMQDTLESVMSSDIGSSNIERINQEQTQAFINTIRSRYPENVPMSVIIATLMGDSGKSSFTNVNGNGNDSFWKTLSGVLTGNQGNMIDYICSKPFFKSYVREFIDTVIIKNNVSEMNVSDAMSRIRENASRNPMNIRGLTRDQNNSITALTIQLYNDLLNLAADLNGNVNKNSLIQLLYNLEDLLCGGPRRPTLYTPPEGPGLEMTRS